MRWLRLIPKVSDRRYRSKVLRIPFLQVRSHQLHQTKKKLTENVNSIDALNVDVELAIDVSPKSNQKKTVIAQLTVLFRQSTCQRLLEKWSSHFLNI